MAVLFLGLWLRRRSVVPDGQPTLRASDPGAGAPVQLPPGAEVEIRRLVTQRKKIEALKLLREHTGWGLKESKDYVDWLSRPDLPLPSLPSATVSGAANLSDSEVIAEVHRLLAQRQKIEAVKFVREQRDWGLKEVKEYVERLERERRTG